MSWFQFSQGSDQAVMFLLPYEATSEIQLFLLACLLHFHSISVLGISSTPKLAMILLVAPISYGWSLQSLRRMVCIFTIKLIFETRSVPRISIVMTTPPRCSKHFFVIAHNATAVSIPHTIPAFIFSCHIFFQEPFQHQQRASFSCSRGITMCA